MGLFSSGGSLGSNTLVEARFYGTERIRENVQSRREKKSSWEFRRPDNFSNRFAIIFYYH
jgi:hypothetical protein